METKETRDNPTFQVGDIVEIKELDSSMPFGVNSRMKKEIGKKAVITRMSWEDRFERYSYRLSNNGWMWSDVMLKLADKIKPKIYVLNPKE